MCSIKFGMNDFLNSTINIPATTGPKSDPITTPSHCRYISLLKVIKYGTIRLKKKISHIIMDAELRNKHIEKRKLKKKILEVTGNLKRKVTVIAQYCIK